MIKKIVSLVVTTAVLGVICSCSSGTTNKYNSGSVVLWSDEGFKSFMDQEVEVFEYQYPGAYVLPKYMSETDAVNGLLKDSCQLAVLSKPLSKDQLEYIKAHNKRIAKQQEIAVDAVALIVNKDNPLNVLSLEEIGDLFNGDISTWKQLAIDNPDSIKIVFDAMGSANVNFIQDKFLKNGAKFGSNVYAQSSNLEVLDAVERDKNAIGFVSVSWLGDHLEKLNAELQKDNIDSASISRLQNPDEVLAVDFIDKVKVLKVRKDDEIRGFEPYQAYINSGEYPLFRVVYLASTAPSQSVGQSFFSFVTGFIGQKIIGLTGIMPYNVHPRLVEIN